jgi:membrane fusion protein, heavy metal efflux system
MDGPLWPPATWSKRQIGAVAVLLCLTGALVIWTQGGGSNVKAELATASPPLKDGKLEPTATQWASLATETVRSQVFRAEHVTEGKVSVNEDRATLIFSPYSGRVTKLLAKPGDSVERGQPLFVVEANDTVQAQNDFITATSLLNKARSQLNLAQIGEKRQRDLYEGKAVALREFQQAQGDLTGAQNDLRSAEIALEASRNRMRILGRSDEDMTALEKRGAISPETSIYAPIAGTIVQRKVGPGQYVTTGTSDPVFVIGDLTTVWLIGYVRESEAPKVQIGQAVNFNVLAFPDRVFAANINYVATSLDPATRRLLVRAVINNTDGLLRPEMFANVTIMTGEGDSSLAISREAIIYEGDSARVWVTKDHKTLESRRIKTGLTRGKMVQILDGLQAGDEVITKGGLFLDRAAVGS